VKFIIAHVISVRAWSVGTEFRTIYYMLVMLKLLRLWLTIAGTDLVYWRENE